MRKYPGKGVSTYLLHAKHAKSVMYDSIGDHTGILNIDRKFYFYTRF